MVEGVLENTCHVNGENLTVRVSSIFRNVTTIARKRTRLYGKRVKCRYSSIFDIKFYTRWCFSFSRNFQFTSSSSSSR